MYLFARHDNETMGLTKGGGYNVWRVTGTPLLLVEENDNNDQVVVYQEAFIMEGDKDADY